MILEIKKRGCQLAMAKCVVFGWSISLSLSCETSTHPFALWQRHSAQATVVLRSAYRHFIFALAIQKPFRKLWQMHTHQLKLCPLSICYIQSRLTRDTFLHRFTGHSLGLTEAEPIGLLSSLPHSDRAPVFLEIIQVTCNLSLSRASVTE